MNLRVTLTSDGAIDLEFVSGSFHGSADDIRVASIFAETTDAAPKTIEIRVEITDVRLAEYDIRGHRTDEAKRIPKDLL